MGLPFRFPCRNSRGIPNSDYCRRSSVICRLESEMPDRSDMPIVLPAPLPEEQVKVGGPERRAQVRFPLAAAAEVFDLRSQTRINGRCSDLSSGGCYVDTLSPLAVGSIVNVRIVRGASEFEAAAVVTYAHVSMGMGLAFTEIRREQQSVLRAWIADLSGQQPYEPSVSATESETEGIEASANVRFVLNELITLLVRKSILTEDEGAGLFRQLLH